MTEGMELPPFRIGGTSFLKTCLNGINALSGIGVITIPYTLAKAGWLSVALLVAMAMITCYTGLLIQRCMDSDPSIKTYPDVGYHAFRSKGRSLVSAFMYLELYLVPTGFLILEADNLHKLFPDAGFRLGGHFIGGQKMFTMAAGLVILPTTWLKDLSLLSFVSAGGIVSTVVIVASIAWVGAVDGVGFEGRSGKVLELGGVGTALSLYAFCFGAHPVFPTLYSSMKDKSLFPKVLMVSFGLSTLIYVSMAVLGYLMFGTDAMSQITLNLPTDKISSKIAIYTTLVGPITKYAIIIMPIVNAIESRLPNYYNTKPICVLLRTLLLMSTIVVALVFPFFGLLMALVGAILNITASILLPCICYLKIVGARSVRWSVENMIICGIIVMAVLVGIVGTYSSVKEIVGKV